jgi:hypothetical protein
MDHFPGASRGEAIPVDVFQGVFEEVKKAAALRALRKCLNVPCSFW